MQKIRKAVIPAAGLGTRVLPATKAMPKEMLPIVDKPAIQYIVEEAVAAGIEQILIITGRGKSIMEDHFDRAPELEAALGGAPAKAKMLEDCLGIANLADIFFLRQKETKGLGHAILKAKPFTGDEPFVVLYGDDVIMGDDPVAAQLCRAYEQYGKPCVGIKEVSREAFTGDEPFVVLYGDDVIMGDDPVAAQLCRAYEQYGKPCVGIKEVSREAIRKYSSLKVDLLHDNLYNVTDMIGSNPQIFFAESGLAARQSVQCHGYD